MTDPLDRLASAAAPLLRRTDAALAEAGAAPGDPVWALLRRLRALPSDAVAAVAGWRAPPLEEAAGPLTTWGRRYTEALEGLPAQPPWQGAGAEAYGRQWTALRAHVLGSGADGLVGRLSDTARYLEATAEWIVSSRRAVAVALAEVLGSAEAVVLVTGSQPPGPAAARVGTHVLTPVATACEQGGQLHDDWRDRLPELAFRQPRTTSSVSPTGAGPLRVGD